MPAVCVQRQDAVLERRPSLLVLSVLLGLLLYLLVVGYTGLFLPFRLVKGTSMQPTLRAGDLVVVKSVPFSDIKLGDIVAFDTPTSVKADDTPGSIMHRVTAIETTDGGLVMLTKGDNTGVDPFWVPASTVWGKLAVRVPSIGRSLVFFTGSKGLKFVAITTLVGLLYAPAMAVFYMVVLRPWKGGALPISKVSDRQAAGQPAIAKKAPH